jgi:hypothetical protein
MSLSNNLLKHAFKVNFNKWIVDVVKQQICNGKEPLIDFKMNNLKPQICGWLHLAWTQVQGMDRMITKGWEKTRITKAFTFDFQVEAMEVNALTPLFTFTLEVEEYNDAKDNETYPTNSNTMVIENCLQFTFTPLGVATIGVCTSTSSYVKVFELKQQARLKQKKPNESKKKKDILKTF